MSLIGQLSHWWEDLSLDLITNKLIYLPRSKEVARLNCLCNHTYFSSDMNDWIVGEIDTEWWERK